jgi:anti-sigma factor RsiW
MTPPVRRLAVVVAAVETSCFEVLALIQRYADGECDMSLAVAVSSHLEGCGLCACELEQLRWLKAAVRRCHGAPESPSWQ